MTCVVSHRVYQGKRHDATFLKCWLVSMHLDFAMKHLIWHSYVCVWVAWHLHTRGTRNSGTKSTRGYCKVCHHDQIQSYKKVMKLNSSLWLIINFFQGGKIFGFPTTGLILQGLDVFQEANYLIHGTCHQNQPKKKKEKPRDQPWTSQLS